MRVKKQKRHRKVVRFYSACFGFREPYKVLLDGTLVHHLLSHGLSPADDALSRVLGARCLLFTTKCIVGEIKSLGPSHTETWEAAKQLMVARCDHEKRVSGTNCILSVIGENNSEHFFVGTQDPDLRKKFREVPGVPVIYGLKNSLFLEQPSFNQREFAKLAEEKRLHMTESELQSFFKSTSKENLSEGDDENQEEQARSILHSKKNSLGVKDKPQFKRNRAKGPNPLSRKKKKPKAGTPDGQNQNKEEPTAKRKRVRKRKRSGSNANNKPDTGS
ncbi:hypothetical protein LUZ61_020113 [Rhynchospora tenuis]|uniref:UTP23 sensor motif region domain-containing protein n=1 Tax=Rhynchospora tenuis TaxID=198213 RepID=A0AAD6ENG7_9POAL|nr:hypothetical protein LUZ61_020113 [Rhynchospora tenuis]